MCHIAAIHGQLKVLMYLLEKSDERLQSQNFDQDKSTDKRGMLPIHYAVLKNNTEMVQYLLEARAEEICYFRSKKELMIVNHNKSEVEIKKRKLTEA